MGNTNSSEGVRFLDGCPEIPQAPAADLVQLRFDELVLFACPDSGLRDELNLAESIRNKWAYAFLSKLPHGNGADEWLDPRQCVDFLQHHRSSEMCSHDLYLAIRINILLRPTWVETFIAENGVDELVAPFQASSNTSTDTCNEIVTTLFVLTNSSVGIAALMKVPRCCRMLDSIFETSSSIGVKIRVLKLLDVLCRGSTMAQDAVLDAFTSKSSDNMSLQSLISNLNQNHLDVELQFTTLKFVNTLLKTTRDEKRQAQVCRDLKTHGIFTLLESYKAQFEDKKSLLTLSMENQITVFLRNYDDIVVGDSLGALDLDLAPGDTLRSNSGQSNHSVAASNQGENDETSELTRPELEEVDNCAVSSAFGGNVELDSDRLKLALATSSPQDSTLENVVNQLQQQTKVLDRQTNEKLANLLQKLVLTLSDDSQATKAVDRLTTSLCSAVVEEPTSDGKAEQEPDLLTRVSMALFPSFNESSTSIAKPPVTGRTPFFSGFGDFSFSSLTSSTPAKNSVSRPSLASFLGAESALQSTDQPTARSAKLSLPFFQSSRKGPGVGVTPACTPIATASVRKDAKRPVFPSFPSPPKNLPLDLGQANESSAAAIVSPVVTPPLVTSSSVIDIATSTSPSRMIKPQINNLDSTTNDIAVEATAEIIKFRKLLSMGAPLEAVRLKMQQAGVNPDLLGDQQGFVPKTLLRLALADITKSDIPYLSGDSLEVEKATSRQIETALNLKDPKEVVTANELIAPSLPQQEVLSHPDIAKSKTPPSTGALPSAHTGLNLILLDEKNAKTSPADPTSSANLSNQRVKDDPKYAKFFKLLSMGAPPAAVKAKMVQAGLNSELLDTPDAVVPVHAAPSSEVAIRVRDEPQYAKFFKLLSMGAPADSVKAKMQMAGLQPELLDSPDATFKSVSDVPALQPELKVKDDPSYAKFFKLLAMGAPLESVKAKVQMAGLRPDLIDTPDASVVSGESQSTSQARVKVKDDPAYAKFFKLLAMGAPAESVKAKMTMAGLQGDLLATPDALLPTAAPVTHSAPPAPITPTARRAHLSIAIKPALQAKTRAFYWQHLKDEAIKGTIWEELEKDYENQSNQELITLSESELKVLETEFPPPPVCGPGTGTRRGVGSGFLSPGGPASPLASPKIVFLIDRARSNNISIIIKQFKMSNATLRVAIMRMDFEVLTLDRVQGLIKMLPTEDEIVAISSFNGDPTTLNGAELVLKELITIPRLKQRLLALETKHQFPALVRDLQTKISKIRMACHEIAQSSELKAILLVILQVGNKMNQDTARGKAKGFRLNDLTKLVQLKSVDKSITLLHYVARIIRGKKSNVVLLGDSLVSLYEVQNISISELQGDMNKIVDITESINVELAAQRLKNRIEKKEESDLFVEIMTAFVDRALQDVATLKTELDETLRLVRDIMLRFDKGENEEEASTSNVPVPPAMFSRAGEFFSTIYEFTMALMKADRENEAKRIREEKRLKQQELKNATPRRSSIDRAKFIGKSASEISEASQLKTVAISSNANVKNEDVQLPFSEAFNKSLTTTRNALEVPVPTRETSPAMNKTINNPIVPTDRLSEEKAEPKCRTSLLKFPEILLKPSALPSVPASPLRKVVGNIPTAIPSPMKVKRIDSQASPMKVERIDIQASPMKVKRTDSLALSAGKNSASNRLAVPFDAASLNEIKLQLKSKKGTNEPQMQQKSKPEIEMDGDEHENNNSEPSSPERALSEAESSYVAVRSDA